MHLSALLSLAALAAATPLGRRTEPAPLLVPRGEPSSLIADSYIVKFREGSALAILEDAMKMLPSGKANHVFENIFAGFSAKMDKLTLEALRGHPDVDYIEQNGVATASAITTQSNAAWGLGRISHRRAGSSQYAYDTSAGAGTCAYVIDSGLDDTHPDFGGRAEQIAYYTNTNYDNCGHGTHVAGTIGSNTYGVAKKTNIYGIKVLEPDVEDPSQCTGSYANIIAGMDLVVKDAQQRGNACRNGVVVNMSLGGPYAQSINDAARRLVDNGVFVGVAAGNENQPAANVSPASESSVCTVGATAINDRRYTGSNYGPQVDIMAPGVDVLSTYPGGRTARLTGTSMATPHVVGLAAYLATLEGKRAGPASCQRIRDLATKNAIVDQTKNTVNLLAFNNATQ